MRGVHRMNRLGIWLIVLGLVFHGVVASAEIEPSEFLAAGALGHVVAVDADDCVSHAADIATAGHGGDHRGPLNNHLKCCARCSMVSLLPSVISVSVAPAFGHAIFYTAQNDLVGRLVALDPHIPKPIA